MATFLDIGVLGYFTVIFTFLLIWVLVYSLLSWVKPFGEKQKGAYAIISIAFAILSVTNGNIVRLVSFMTPWFFILLFIAFMILFGMMLFGWKSDDIAKKTKDTNYKTYLIIIVIVVFIFGIGSSFGQETLEAGSDNGERTNIPNQNEQETITENTGSITVDPIEDGRFPANTQPGTGAPNKTASEDFGSNVLNTFVNPKVLGLILILLVAVFAMFFLTKSTLD